MVKLAIDAEDRATLLDALILCKFLRRAFTDLWGDAAEMLRLVTGWDIDDAELRTTAKRIVRTKKQFNIAAGWTPSEDSLPDRFFDESLPEDDARLDRSTLQRLIERYNMARGWTKEGYL